MSAMGQGHLLTHPADISENLVANLPKEPELSLEEVNNGSEPNPNFL